jgi:hypothetical protein
MLIDYLSCFAPVIWLCALNFAVPCYRSLLCSLSGCATPGLAFTAYNRHFRLIPLIACYLPLQDTISSEFSISLYIMLEYWFSRTHKMGCSIWYPYCPHDIYLVEKCSQLCWSVRRFLLIIYCWGQFLAMSWLEVVNVSCPIRTWTAPFRFWSRFSYTINTSIWMHRIYAGY